ncbi:MAG: hypothetical protein LBS81_06025 [Endomicrobium sp.]|jgi:hypothetical protein|nr:hypothetical protein [Endomicrobium sp.]
MKEIKALNPQEAFSALVINKTKTIVGCPDGSNTESFSLSLKIRFKKN